MAYKQNQAALIYAHVVATADASDITTGVTTEISQNGGAFAATTNSAAHLVNGVWTVSLTATETNTPVYCVKFTGASAKTECVTVSADTKLVSELTEFDPATDEVLANVVNWRGSQPNNIISGRVDANAGVVGDKAGYSIQGALTTLDALAADLKILIDSGTAQAATSNTLTLRAAFTGTVYRGANIVIKSATAGAGQVAIALSYVSGTKVATLTAPWEVTPTGTITYEVYASVRDILDVADDSDSRRIDQIWREIRAVTVGRASGGGLIFATPDNSVTRVTTTVDGSANRTSVDVSGAD